MNLESTVKPGPVLDLRDATLRFGPRTLWAELTMAVGRGEFIAVLGGNGSGKTSLLRAILGMAPLSSGQVLVGGREIHRGSAEIGYIPQQRRIDQLTPMRARDMVRLGLDGHRWGVARPGRIGWDAVDEALVAVGAAEIGDAPFGVLSGGQQQRVRIAQAIVRPRALLLCDEPLLSLDPVSQVAVTSLIAHECHAHGTAALFVTHEITPVIQHVDRVLYLADGKFRIGTVDEVLNVDTLSSLYGAPVEVFQSGDRVVVAGIPDDAHHTHAGHGES